MPPRVDQSAGALLPGVPAPAPAPARRAARIWVRGETTRLQRWWRRRRQYGAQGPCGGGRDGEPAGLLLRPHPGRSAAQGGTGEAVGGR